MFVRLAHYEDNLGMGVVSEKLSVLIRLTFWNNKPTELEIRVIMQLVQLSPLGGFGLAM